MTSFNRRILSNKTKHSLIVNKLKKIKSFDLGYFIGKSYFDEDGAQTYLVFQSTLKYFTLNSNWIANGNQKDYLTKVLKLFLCLIILWLQQLIIMGNK